MNTWKLSWHGVWTVTLLDLKQRVRSRRWIWALVGWFVLILGFTVLILKSIESGSDVSSSVDIGVVTFGAVTYFTLGMSLILAPTFTATAINGDRNGGTLALLQVSRLSAFEIATGKLIAAWLTAAMFLAVSLPFLIWALVVGAIPLGQVVVCYAVMFAEVAVICAIGLGWSALVSRPAGSAVLTYLTAALITVIAPLIMVLSVNFTTSTDEVRVWGLTPAQEAKYSMEVDQYWEDNPDGDGSGIPAAPFEKCMWFTEKVEQQHMEKVWWLLAPNPFVVVADAAPLPETAKSDLSTWVSDTGDPLLGLQLAVRTIRRPPATEIDRCTGLYENNPAYVVTWDRDGNVTKVTTANGTPVPISTPVKHDPVTVDQPIWPWGLGANAILGGLFFWIAVRRLRVPYGRLPSDTRVA